MNKTQWQDEADQILTQILNYLRLNEGVSNIGQEPYKSDMFKIFRNAYVNGFCGTKYKASCDNGIIKARPKKPQICGDSIWAYAKAQGWVTAEMDGDNKRYKNIDKVQRWWDEWTYAWDWNPPKRKYKRPS